MFLPKLFTLQSYFSICSELQRIENLTNSPVISHLSETIQGVTTIRAYNQQARFTEILFKRLEANTIAFTILNTSNRWLGISLVSPLRVPPSLTVCLSGLSVRVVGSFGLLRSICQLCTFDLRKHVYIVCALHLNISTRLASHLTDADASATEHKFYYIPCKNKRWRGCIQTFIKLNEIEIFTISIIFWNIVI